MAEVAAAIAGLAVLVALFCRCLVLCVAQLLHPAR